MKLTKHKINKIQYTKKGGEVSNRDIIPTVIPGNVSALDVSDMDDETKDLLLTRLGEYNEFTSQIREQMLTFDKWLAATHKNEPIEGIKWRTFIVENISPQ